MNTFIVSGGNGNNDLPLIFGVIAGACAAVSIGGVVIYVIYKRNRKDKYRIVLITESLRTNNTTEVTSIEQALSLYLQESLDDVEVNLLQWPFKTMVFDVTLPPSPENEANLSTLLRRKFQLQLQNERIQVTCGYVKRNTDGREKISTWLVTGADGENCEIPSSLKLGFVDKLQSELLKSEDTFLATVYLTSSKCVTINVVYEETGTHYENLLVSVIRGFRFEDAENPDFKIMKDDKNDLDEGKKKGKKRIKEISFQYMKDKKPGLTSLPELTRSAYGSNVPSDVTNQLLAKIKTIVKSDTVKQLPSGRDDELTFEIKYKIGDLTTEEAIRKMPENIYLHEYSLKELNDKETTHDHTDDPSRVV